MTDTTLEGQAKVSNIIDTLGLYKKPREPYPYEPCPICDGSGLVLNYNGEPDDCRTCCGTGIVRARDKNGRFVGEKDVGEEY